MSFCTIEPADPNWDTDPVSADMEQNSSATSESRSHRCKEPLRWIVLEEEFYMSGPRIEILVVDDDSDQLQLLSLVLLKLGYGVRLAEDGFSALSAMRTAVPDVLLSDLYMPGMSGFELLSVVRRRHPKIAVIAMSGAYSGSEVPVGVAADVFYEKATGLKDLLSRMEEMGSLAAGRRRDAREFGLSA
jgi:CheY-like chemotaxis protein